MVRQITSDATYMSMWHSFYADQVNPLIAVLLLDALKECRWGSYHTAQLAVFQ